MSINFRLLSDKQFLPANVSKIIINQNHTHDIEIILNEMRFKQDSEKNSQNVEWLVHPLGDLENFNGQCYAYFEPNNKLNKLIAQQGTLLQQISYLELMGITPAIERCPDFKVALTYYNFCKNLNRLGIKNPLLTQDAGTIKRIHAVHPVFLSDDEISAGLSISYQKNSPNNQVLYVCSPETLELALSICAPHSKLTIDGHWEHAKKSEHGVWDVANAEQIAIDLSRLLKQYPEKVNAINLLGCEAGSLADLEDLPPTFNPYGLVFKDENLPSITEKEMAVFRNRATYFSGSGEFPFAQNSLAAQIILHLDTRLIKVTASSSYTYPYPAQNPRFNIGSDSKEWRGEHEWKERDLTTPAWYRKLHQSKITYADGLSFFGSKSSGEDVASAFFSASTDAATSALDF